LKNGKTGTVSNPPFYLQGGAGGRGLAAPSALRFFVGGGTGTSPGNICGFDNLIVMPVITSPGPGAAQQGATLHAELLPLPKSIATATSN
jgi:hypothetical protein